MTGDRALSAKPMSQRPRDEIDGRYLERRLEAAAATEVHCQELFSTHARRLTGIESCLERFRSSVEALRQQRTGAALAAVEEYHNELCVAEELLLFNEPPFSLIEYEPLLPNGDERIDFRATNSHSVWFVEVKTIHPELKDRWDQYQRVVEAGHIVTGALNPSNRRNPSRFFVASRSIRARPATKYYPDATRRWV